MTRIVYIVTQPNAAAWHMRGQLAWMRERGYDVTCIASPGKDLDIVAEREKVRTVALPMEREIGLAADARGLAQMLATLRKLKPDIVNAGTPKAALLGMLAARALNIRARIYTMRGLRLETTDGAKRGILNSTERITAFCAHRVVCVSHSLRAKTLELRLASPQKTIVIGGGSSNGIDGTRFFPTHDLAAKAAALRDQHHIPADATVIGFVGRFTRDKGIAELVEAFETLAATHPNLYLLLVGDFEDGDPVAPHVRERISTHPRIVVTGFVEDPAPAFNAMNILAFPSYREGFPNVVLQASAAELPIAGFSATGVVDGVVDGTTGLLAAVGDAKQLTANLARYLDDPALGRAHGTAGRARVEREFQQEVIWRGLETLYLDVLREHGGPQ